MARERMHINDWLRIIGLVIVVLCIIGSGYLDLRNQNAKQRVEQARQSERTARLEVKVDLILRYMNGQRPEKD